MPQGWWHIGLLVWIHFMRLLMLSPTTIGENGGTAYSKSVDQTTVSAPAVQAAPSKPPGDPDYPQGNPRGGTQKARF